MSNMLNEYKKDIKKVKTEKLHKNIKWVIIKNFLWANRWKILLFFVIILLIFFPITIGTSIGTWISNFVGSLMQNIAI
jgi:hypothetical protein